MVGIRIVYSEKYLQHKPRGYHVENPSRILTALKTLENIEKELVEPLPVSTDEVITIHDPDYVREVELKSMLGEDMDSDTYVSRETFESALYALGGALKSYEVQGFGLLRPPGHHAGIRGAAFSAPTLGFCIFNNMAYVARKLGKRVAILDFDVHHGNGTQEIVYNDPQILHVDLHQDPLTLYPGTGFPEDLGEGEAKGTKINIPLPPGSSDDIYREALDIAEEVIEQFSPEVIGFSAGFDGFLGDGLADLELTESSYYRLGRMKRLGHRYFAVLEGGYSSGLERGVPAFVKGLIDEDMGSRERISDGGAWARWREIKFVMKNEIGKYWKI